MISFRDIISLICTFFYLYYAYQCSDRLPIAETENEEEQGEKDRLCQVNSDEIEVFFWFILLDNVLFRN